jgi:hypothetical protein
MILEYFSLGKGPFTELCERLEKFLLFYFRIITSYLKMSGMPCHKIYKTVIFYFHFDIFIFENKVARDKMQLDWQFSLYPAAVECPVVTKKNIQT